MFVLIVPCQPRAGRPETRTNVTLSLINHDSLTQPAGDADGEVSDSAPHEASQPEDPDPAKGHDLVVALDLSAPDCDPPAEPWLGDQFRRIARLAGVVDGLISLVVVDDAEMTELHKQYRDEPGTTDVLTFDLRDNTDRPATTSVEGDLVLCMDEARRQAEQRGHDTRLELLLYAVHGLLHLLGEDDHDPAAFARMHKREDELLTQAGFGPVFDKRSDKA